MENHIKDSWTIPLWWPETCYKTAWQTLQATTVEPREIGILSESWERGETGNCVWVVLRVDPGQDVLFTSQTSTGQKGNSRSPAIHQTPAHKQVLSTTRSHTQSLNSSYWYTELLCLQALLSLGLACTPLIPPIYKRAPKYTQRLIKVGHPLLKRIPVLWDEKVISPSTP